MRDLMGNIAQATPTWMVLLALIGGPTTYLVEEHLEQARYQDALRKEIAVNFANNWHLCDVAARFDPTVLCVSGQKPDAPRPERGN